MNAFDLGLKRGKDYLLRFSCEYLKAHMTFAEYKAIGHVDAKQQYPSSKGQTNFLLGWWNIGEQYITLFCPDDSELYGAQQKIKYVRTRLDSVRNDLAPLLAWREDEAATNDLIQDAFESLERAQEHLKRLQAHLAKQDKVS